MRSAINTALFILFLLLAFLTSVASHADEPLCPVGITTGSKTWTWSQYGNNPYICVRSCTYAVVASVCTDTLDACSSDFISTGVVCNKPDGMISGGSLPEPPTPEPPNVVAPIINAMPDNILSGFDYGKSFKSIAGVTGLGVLKLHEMRESQLESTRDISAIKGATQSTNTYLNSLKTTLGYIQNNSELSAQYNQVTANWLGQIYNSGSTGGGGSVDVTAIKNSIDNSLVPNSYILNNNIQTMTGRLDNIKNSLDNNHNSQTNFFARKMDELISAVGSSGGGDGGGDNSGVINALNNQTTELKGGLNSLGQGIDSLNDALSTGSYVSREFKGKVDFDTVGLYKPDLLESVLADTEELKQQYEQQIDEFKKICCSKCINTAKKKSW
ncbi:MULTISPECIES: hypothetical protein [unclassified Vibrio]|uniref:hypothetical protein n=1 Tax=unclassified Vibrio TaxID=2614977 RepID=UPI00148356F6|nr:MULTISPECIES: hypothetical protein [unclassified Vibrio]MDQ2195008.1 hypothetical protein [Vibrio sp. A14(2019)]MDQ2198540.1 hypothetical protein [Vibrio sp. 2017_1457_11]NNN77628.1 hypothetical protein [Vibrio sp. B7]NNN94418.1 hypothetical protein [Vibrio sp. B8-1]NNO09591.1 hypothetical protein [Vibrio sp. B4-12]